MINLVRYTIDQLHRWGLPGGSEDKESTYNAGDLGLIPELGRSPGVGLENPHGQRSLAGYSPWNSLGQNTGVGPFSRGSSQPRDQT